jgi:nucleoside-diphosphate-sugar epimerase
MSARSATTSGIHSLGWRGQAPMEQGIALTYPWIEAQVKKARAPRRCN